jgi:sialate O-acetylesterase
MPRLLSPTCPRVALAAALALACVARPAAGQSAGSTHRLKSPVPHQVIQRDSNGLGTISVALPDDLKDLDIEGVQVFRPDANSGFQLIPGTVYRDGKVERVPAGGPYLLTVSHHPNVKNESGQVSVGAVFVGDLWVLAGQSNMEGVGKLIDVTPPDDRVMALGMDGKWVRAEEPLHWLVDSPDPVHSGDPATRAERSAKDHKTRNSGAGLGLPFAAAMVEATGVPVGLVVSAHGGTSMEQWSPSKKGEGGKSLYGSMLRQVKLAGGKVKGVLWYQGESDANDKAAIYAKTFADFIGAVRGDLDRSDLPFYFVQIGRFVNEGDPKPWNAVQDAQRKIPDDVPNTAVVAAVDLELDDLIHVGTPGLKRLGQRLANIALREQFGQIGASTPTLDRVSKGPGNTLVVKFKGVNRTEKDGEVTGLQPDRHIGGFSIRKADGKEIPYIFDARVGPSRDAVVLKLIGDKIPEGSSLWYGWGRDPYCNLVDALDMAVPVFGPIALDGVK